MKDLVAAVGLAVVLEGLLYAAAPSAVKRYMLTLVRLDDARLRYGGIACMVFGVIVVWLARME